uniref:Uncharacterized protein n=1 Tax=Arundo donax TaxID=35708 RepID=A0A0A9DCU4_ARUDO
MAVTVEAVGPIDRPHADGRGDGVANGHANQVDVLGQGAQPVLGNPKVCPDGLSVGVVALAVDGVGCAVAVGEEAGAEPGDDGEGQQHHGADHPPQLRDRPRQRQHTRPDHRRDDVRARRHQRTCAPLAAVVVEVRPVAEAGLHDVEGRRLSLLLPLHHHCSQLFCVPVR